MLFAIQDEQGRAKDPQENASSAQLRSRDKHRQQGLSRPQRHAKVRLGNIQQGKLAKATNGAREVADEVGFTLKIAERKVDELQLPTFLPLHWLETSLGKEKYKNNTLKACGSCGEFQPVLCLNSLL